MTIISLASSRPTVAPAAAAAARRRGGVRCRRTAPPPASLFRGRVTPSLVGRTKSNNVASDVGNHLGSASPGTAARPRIPAPAPVTRGACVRGPRAVGGGGGGGGGSGSGDKRDTQSKPSEGDKQMMNDMSDDEALGIIERTLQARMSPTAARAISQGFLDIGHFAHYPFSLGSSQLNSQPFCFVPEKSSCAVSTGRRKRGPRRKPGASSYTLTRYSLFTRGGATAWCLLIHADAPLSLKLRSCPKT